MSEDMVWSTTDPLGRAIHLRAVMAERRERMGKHPGADHMDTGETRATVERPHLIQQSASDSNRNSYYRYEQEFGKPPYLRATVALSSTEEGYVISWGRQREPAKHEVPIYVDYKNRR